MDPGRAPERIGVRHLLDQDSQVRAYRRASWPAMPPAMPADDGLGPYHVQDVAPARPAATKVNPEEPVEPSEPRPLRALVQESELLPKRKVLENQIPMRSQGRSERAQQGDQDGPHGRVAWFPWQVPVKSGDSFLANDTRA